MKILHLVPSLMTGGQETMLINIANEQVKEHDIYIVIINKDYDVNLLGLFDKRVKIKCIDRPRSSKNPWYFIKLNWIIQNIHPYVVHLHYEKLICYLIPLGFKCVYTIHGFTIPPKYLKKNRNLVSISKGIQNDTSNRANVRSEVIYNGIKIDCIKHKSMLLTYENTRPYRIVQVSRLFHEIKGQDILIKAMALLKNKGYANLQLDFIGEGTSFEYLRKLVEDLELNNVNFLGTKSVEYINTNLCSYDLFVQASRHEGFGLSVVEAMCAKLPVIISNCDGLMEVVDNGKYGLVFEKGSAEDCANKIEELLTSNFEYVQNRVNDAYEFVQKEFDIKYTASNYIKFYLECE